MKQKRLLTGFSMLVGLGLLPPPFDVIALGISSMQFVNGVINLIKEEGGKLMKYTFNTKRLLWNLGGSKTHISIENPSNTYWEHRFRPAKINYAL